MEQKAGNRRKVLDEKNKMELLHYSMAVLNGFIIISVSFLMIHTIDKVTYWNMSEVFLSKMDYIPFIPWMSGFFAIVGFVVLLLVSHMRKRIYFGIRTFYIAGCGEIIAALVIIMALHMSYNGILLLVTIDLLEMIEKKQRVFLLFGTLVVYIITSLSMVQEWLGIVPMKIYMTYYDTSAANVINSLFTLLSTVNIVLFLIYMILLLQYRKKENIRIRELNRQLEVMNEQLKTYAQETEQMTRVKERNRLAREIHDTLGHALTGIVAAADACSMMMAEDDKMSSMLMREIAETARQGMKDVRRSVKALRPDALENRSLKEALYEMVDRINRTTQTVINLYIEEMEQDFSADEEDIIFRIVQEGITNSMRHGKAAHIWVTLKLEDKVLHVMVKDDGIGMTDDKKEGFGLRHMQERLDLLKGWIEYDGTQGFILHAYIPIRLGGKVL